METQQKQTNEKKDNIDKNLPMLSCRNKNQITCNSAIDVQIKYPYKIDLILTGYPYLDTLSVGQKVRPF